MPRKVSYGIDHDLDYDDYDDDDDYNSELDVEGDGTEETLKDTKTGIWRCPICTYDNDGIVSACGICGNTNPSKIKECSTTGVWKCHICTFDNGEFESACEICGVLRYPAVKVNCNGSKETDRLEEVSPPEVFSNIKRKKEQFDSLPSTRELYSSSIQLEEVQRPSIIGSTSFSDIGAKSEKLMHGLDKESLAVDSEGPRTLIMTERTAPHSQYKPETWMLARDKEPLTQLNLAIVGHVDAGKSTLSGRLLNLLGRISPKEMRKFEKEAKQKGKGSFAYAWAMDESAEERDRGITMTVAVAYFDTKKYHIVVLDSPGHQDFIPNMINGANQADAAILVIDASVGSFEAGMDGGGQTREHAQLIRSFGVDQVIVAINKMDIVEYSKERYDFIKGQVGSFLRGCGFRDSFLIWVPLSAMENQNLVAAASDARLSSWYKGPFLFDAIDSLQPPIRDISKPLIMPICDVIKSRSVGQVAVSGKLETGALRCGLKVLVMPDGELATVRLLEHDSQACDIAKAGDNVVVCLQGIEANNVMAGGVLCHPDYPVAVATHLELKILMLDVAVPLLIGSQMEFHIHHSKTSAKVIKIPSLLDPKTGKVLRKGPRILTAKQSALIEVNLDGTVCVEEFANCRALGRVFLRAQGKTAAVGIVTRVVSPL